MEPGRPICIGNVLAIPDSEPGTIQGGALGSAGCTALESQNLACTLSIGAPTCALTPTLAAGVAPDRRFSGYISQAPRGRFLPYPGHDSSDTGRFWSEVQAWALRI